MTETDVEGERNTKRPLEVGSENGLGEQTEGRRKITALSLDVEFK